MILKKQQLSHKGQIGIKYSRAKRGYRRKGLIGGKLDEGPLHSKNFAYLISNQTARKIPIHYPESLHPEISTHIGTHVVIRGIRHYDYWGKLISMDAESIEANKLSEGVREKFGSMDLDSGDGNSKSSGMDKSILPDQSHLPFRLYQGFR